MSARSTRIPPFARDDIRIRDHEPRGPLTHFHESLGALAGAIRQDLAPRQEMPRVEARNADVLEGAPPSMRPGAAPLRSPAEVLVVSVDLTSLMRDIEQLGAPVENKEPDRDRLTSLAARLLRPWKSVSTGQVSVALSIHRALELSVARAKSAGMLQ